MKRFPFFILCLSTMLFAKDINLNGTNEMHFALDSIGNDEPSTYFTDIFDLNLFIENFSFTTTFEVNTPPFPASKAQDGVHFSNYLFEYEKDMVKIQAGTMTPVFGNGITLRMFEDRDLGWKTDVLGAGATFTGDILSAQFFAGLPRDPSGERAGAIEGLSVLATPSNGIFQGGFTAVMVDSLGLTNYWGSLIADLYLPFLILKGEFAAKDINKDGADFNIKQLFNNYSDFSTYGKAAYFNATSSFKTLTLFAEAKNYQNMVLSNPAPLNSPPTAMRVHLFSLFADAQPELEGRNEKGWLVEASQRFGEQLLTVSYTNSRYSSSNDELYEEVYAQFDMSLEKLISTFALAYQTNTSGDYYLGAINSELAINHKFSIKGEFQHSYNIIDNDFVKGRKFFDQAALLSFILPQKHLTFSAIGAATSDPAKAKGENSGLYTKGWFGIQTDWGFNENNRLSVFVGTRKDGKVCAGGICIKKPEMKGVELLLTSYF